MFSFITGWEKILVKKVKKPCFFLIRREACGICFLYLIDVRFYGEGFFVFLARTTTGKLKIRKNRKIRDIPRRFVHFRPLWNSDIGAVEAIARHNLSQRPFIFLASLSRFLRLHRHLCTLFPFRVEWKVTKRLCQHARGCSELTFTWIPL